MEDKARNLSLNFRGRRILVTGGFGYVGNAIVRALLRHGADLVVIFDVNQPHLDLAPDPEMRSLLKAKTKSACNLDTVIHVASFGMSGVDMLTTKRILDVNVGGTKAILETCIELGIENLVYTSSYNAVFYGQKISNAVDVPYPDVGLHVDAYSKSKTLVEKLVLESNNRPLKKGGRLRTVAIRPAAIYGPAEMRHFPRIIDNLRKGILKFTVGNENDLVEWVYIDNLVYGHLLAAQKLQDEPSRVSGKAYPISDQKPMNNWLFLKPLFEGLGYWYPTIKLPSTPMFYFAYFLEMIHLALSKAHIRFEPFLARAEVVKVGVEHYFNPINAQKDLNYFPIVTAEEGIHNTVEYFKKNEVIWQKKHGSGSLLVKNLFVRLLLLLLFWLLFRKLFS